MTTFLLIWLLVMGSQQPAVPSSQFQRAVALQQQGKLEEAAAEYRKLLQSDPANAEAHANLGVVLSRLGKAEDAIASYSEALRLAPTLAPILLNVGILHFRSGQFEKAVDAFDRFLQAHPNHLQARQLLGISLVEISYNTAGIAQLEPTLSAGPPDQAVLYSLGLAYIRTNQMKQAEVMVASLAQLPTGVATSRLLKGQLQLARFEFESAVSELKEARRLQPDLPRLHYSLGLCYFKLALNKEALAEFRAELKQRPGDFTTVYYLATLLEAENELEAAATFANQAYSMQPASVEVITLLGKVLSRQGKNEEAATLIEKAVNLDPKDSIKRNLLGRIYRELGRREDSTREFNEARRLKAEETKSDRERAIKP